VAEVCLRTGDVGADATGLYSTDELLPDVFARPYLVLEPELAFVVDDGQRAVGYVLGTADTARWAAAHRATWLPTVAARYPLVAPPVSAEDHLVHLLHHPERNVRPELAAYPAHLHIDLLPQAQGRGLGRLLIGTFLAALRERSIPGVHLVTDRTNVAAVGFYRRLGLREVPTPDEGAVVLVARADLEVTSSG